MSSMKSSKKPIIDMPSKEQLAEAIKPPFNKEVPGKELEEKINKLMEFFDLYGIDYKKFKPEFMSYIPEDLDKKAYPNYDQYMYIPGRHDMKKWILALKNIHYKQKAGLEYKEAIRQSTPNWPKMEIYDFLNWLRFHEEGAHMKYKFAQVWYENNQPGYFLHIKPDPPKQVEPQVDANAVNEAREEASRKEEKRQIVEKQRQKIIGRLDSAEKLLRSPDGQMFAGTELENLMEAIYNLKKKVQLVNKISTSIRLYEDMIVREANVLKRNGFVKAAEMLYSVAQTPGASAQNAEGTTDSTALSPSPPPDPSGAGQSGIMSGLPATAPGVPNVQTPVNSDQNTDTPPLDTLTPAASVEDPQPKGIKEFIENMNAGNMTDEDDLEVVDELHVNDPEMELLVTEAQAAPPVPPGVPPAALEDVPITDQPAPERRPPAFIPTIPPEPGTEAPVEPEAPLEVTEEDIEVNDEPANARTDFDNQIDNALKNVTIGDIVEKLEKISKYYKTREHPRELSMVDMMLDSIGLASLFPSLSEALNKSLEANNYISTRVDDILAKLRGAMASQENTPKPPPQERPDVAGIKTKLQTDQEKENKRKQMRKEQEAAALEEPKKETPQVELGELGAPAAPPAAPIPPKPLG